MGLRFLRSNGRSFRRVEVSAGYELDELLVRLKLLLHQRLHVGFFSLEDLLDLAFLVIGQIELMKRQSQSMVTHKLSMHPVMHRAARSGAFFLRDGCA